MNIFRHKEYIKEYELELLKQTAPYDYYLIASGGDTGSGKADGRGKKGRKAVLNVDEGSLNEELTDRFSDYRVYELSEWYIFIKEPAVPDWTVISEGLGSEEPLVYFDHDYITRGKRHTPYFKPEWSPDTFLSCDYIDDVFAVRAELFESEAYGSKLKKAANIHELIWQIAGKGADIGHVGRIAAHIETDSLFDEEVYEEYVRERNGITVQKALKALRGDACPVKGDSYFVSVIIPSKDHSEILENCLRSIIKSSFNKLNIEVLIVDNGSIESEKNKITDIINNVCNEFGDKHPEREGAFAIKYIYEPMEFDFSTMCTLGAREARYGLLLFLNDDIEVRDEDAIEKMCSCAMREDIGAVGVKLLYPETTLIQHDGITDLDCGPSHKLAGHDDRSVYYFGVNRFNRNVLAVTGACLMIGKEKYFNIGGFNVKMKVSYNDVELCLKCLKKGLRNLLLNDTVMYHHESLLRGRDDISEEKRRRLTVERELLYRTNEWLKRDGDPYYSRSLIPDTLDYRVNTVPEYEKRSVRSPIRELDRREVQRIRKKKTDRHLLFNLERFEKEYGIGDERTDYYLAEGWLIDDRRDNALFDRSLILIHGDEGIEALMLPKYREDVTLVHKKAKRAALAGFVCKIPSSFIDESRHYETYFVLKDKGRKNGRIAVWDSGILQGDVREGGFEE